MSTYLDCKRKSHPNPTHLTAYPRLAYTWHAPELSDPFQTHSRPISDPPPTHLHFVNQPSVTLTLSHGRHTTRKVMFLQRLYNLGNKQIEHHTLGRMSVKEVLDIKSVDGMPGEKTCEA